MKIYTGLQETIYDALNFSKTNVEQIFRWKFQTVKGLHEILEFLEKE